ncbi:hypothetical protein EMCRGX_G003563 [Ephydatia muelleri]
MHPRWASNAIKEISVYKSTSHNVWVNLSFEDWILSKVDLTCRRILFLWRNSPCVVIGRHQNPWLETNIAVLRDKGVLLARRRSGGGAVYHDLGNMNCTVFTHRQDYDRERNLQLVCEALNRGWGLDLSVNKHHDIISGNQLKVSGSSSKLAKDSAFHHFTLLLCADTANMTTLLRPAPLLSLTNTSATLSRRSSTLNLSSRSHDITWDAACSHIASAFYSAHDITLTNQQRMVEVEPGEEGRFPGISKMADELKDWYWIYGKTPKFTLKAENEFKFGHLVFTAEVEGGAITSCDIILEHSSATPTAFLNNLKDALTGKTALDYLRPGMKNVTSTFIVIDKVRQTTQKMAAWLESVA